MDLTKRDELGIAAMRNPTLAVALLSLSACGGGGGDLAGPAYTVTGSVTGLVSGASVVLQNNGANDTTVSVNASFSFGTALANGATYAVTVLTQPTGEVCTVSAGSGVVAGANVSVGVACTANSYTVGGNVVGLLPGNGVALATAGSGASVSANGAFALSPELPAGTAYAVIISAQPPGQNCSVTNGIGVVAGSNVTNVAINCSALSFTVSASEFGLLPNTTVVVQNNGGDNLTLSGAGTSAFKTSLPTQSSYSVSVLTQPGGQTCFVLNGQGAIVDSNISVTVVCPWHIAYVTNFYVNTISGYYIDPTSGGLLPLAGNPFVVGAFPGSVAIAPGGKFAYVTNQTFPGTVSAFSIDPITGGLTPINGSPFAAGAYPRSLAIAPAGNFLYEGSFGVPNDGAGNTVEPNGISAFTINALTGALTPIAGSQFTNIPSAIPMEIGPQGTFLYTSAATYSIDQSTGVLASVAGGIGTGGSFPSSLVLDPTGNFIYSAYSNLSGPQASGNVAGYVIDSASGALTPIPGSPFAAGLSPDLFSIAITPNGRYAYVVDGAGDVFAYNINQSTGVLSSLTGSPYAIQASASAIAIDPSGQFAYVSNIAFGSIWAFAINASSGALTPLVGSPFDGPPFAIGGGYSIAISTVP
jgi:6-phosphogluconolactonase (cycloisomerase 2 family)